MKHAVSNIALPAYEHTAELGRLAALGLTGLEVAPSRVWHDTWSGLTPIQVKEYRASVEAAGLRVVGLHSLFFDHPDLTLFGNRRLRERTIAYLVHLSGICRDLGGRTLVYGSRTARTRGDLSREEADRIVLDTFQEVDNRIRGHGTCYCLEPLAPADGDYVNSVMDAVELVETLELPTFRVQIDIKALAANGEVNSGVFERCRPWLVHYHANEPGLEPLGASGEIDHALGGNLLRQIDYRGYVSIEQRMFEEADALENVAISAGVLKRDYA